MYELCAVFWLFLIQPFNKSGEDYEKEVIIDYDVIIIIDFVQE